MTIPQQTPIERQTANGTNDRFSFVFRILDNTDLYVYQNGILQTEAVDYDLENVTELGGDVVFLIAPAAGTLITIERNTPDTQATNYEAGDPFPAESTETALDKLTMLIQEISSRTADFLLDKIGLAWDALNYRITNLGDPQLPEDAVNQRSMENYVANNAPTGGEGPSGPTGDDGDIGPVGQGGPPGVSTEWFTVTAAPDPALGIDDDYAINSVNGDFYKKINGNWVIQGNLQGPIGGGSGTNDHSQLINLANDDHLQYITEARGDARYYIQSFLDNALNTKSFVGHTHLEDEVTDLDKYTQAETNNLLAQKSDLPHTHDATTANVMRIRQSFSNDVMALTDAGKKISFAAATPVTLLVPLHSVIPYADFATVIVHMRNTHAVTITPDAGVTLRSFPNVLGARTMSGAGAHVILHYRPDLGVDTWDLDGRLL